ncbi:hypothetical protein L6452_30750 [Arctium lappa]|uniref:Uncharacterized protein n=1 Tax=Arctium lappa TaxID=4217 RepID=A0ACB8ZJ10_ARCLA|nr:hypothetical protein L6452_30750 [Arctium lappa]
MAEEIFHDQSVQMDEHDPNVSREMPMPSRSHFSAVDANPDLQLINPQEYLSLSPNNHHVIFDNLMVKPVIKEILKNHPICTALTTTATVPMIYLQQAWRTIEHVVQGNRKHFTIRIDNFTSILTFQRLRLLLDLPLPDSREGKTTFDPYPTDHEMVAGIRALGYVGNLTKMSDFRKSNLPPFYYQFFSVINKCLTSRHSGHGNTNIHTLRLFHAIIYDLHVDYVVTIWTELYEKVLSKRHTKKPKYVPYQRFLQIIVRGILRSNRDIPKRSHHESAPENEMTHLQKQKQSFSFEMPIPAALLAYADQNAPSVRQYRESMGLPEPEILTQDSEPVSRAESVRVQHTTGVVERESEQRENIERGSGVGRTSVLEGVGTQAQSATHLVIPISQPEIAIIPQLGTQEENPNESQNSEKTISVGQASSSSTSVPSATSAQDAADQGNDQNVNSDDNLGHSFAFLENVSLHHSLGSTARNPDLEDVDSIIRNIVSDSGVIRQEEGVIVENPENVRTSVNVEKEHGSSVCIRTYHSRRVATSTTSPHVLRARGIETDISRPLMHMHTSASHSIASQQAIVSTFHGDLAHTLSVFHSEMAGIETRTQLPPSLTSFSAPLSLEPIVTSIFIPRTQPIISAITGRLSDPVGTSVVDPQSGLRGSGGSPVIANIMPALSTGHTVVSSTAVLTGSLSSPGVTLPEFVSREFLNDALKVVETPLS